ncbi:hypothetical protein M407DRAFT_34664 [Tulasnella calospora MUT 4182]|uniref:Uncharacterized protein n=1 Tax=Tulasnella calospora MUT 4182 TaxID=1051891 RepID=A0A0C3PMZ5_9AGAM|nr:hypothetical protein M407DRAFT_34664 [Tulasnella calospora MUT 4182]
MTHRVRTSNQIQIFGKEIASQLEACLRPTSLLLQQQLGYDAESGKYQRVPPIIRANPEEPASPNNMLNSEVVIQAMLMGPASLGKDIDPDISLSGKCNGRIWHITSVTAGVIAFAATLIRYALSPDNEFGPLGLVSGITYLEDFEYYKKCLLVGQHKKLRPVVELFDNLNRGLFSHFEKNWRAYNGEPSSSTGDDKLFREIIAAESGEDDEGDGGERTEMSCTSVGLKQLLSAPRPTPIPSDQNEDVVMGGSDERRVHSGGKGVDEEVTGSQDSNKGTQRATKASAGHTRKPSGKRSRPKKGTGGEKR